MNRPEVSQEEIARELLALNESTKCISAYILGSPERSFSLEITVSRFSMSVTYLGYLLTPDAVRSTLEDSLNAIQTALKDPAIDEDHLASFSESEGDGVRNPITTLIDTTEAQLGLYPQTRDLIVEASRHSGLPIEPLLEIPYDVFYTESNDGAEKDTLQTQAVTLLGDMVRQQAVIPDSDDKADRVAALVSTAIDFSCAAALDANSSETLTEMLNSLIKDAHETIRDPRIKERAIDRIRELTDVAQIEIKLRKIKEGIAQFSAPSQ